MAAPPSELGGDHGRVTEPSPAAASVTSGASGAVKPPDDWTVTFAENWEVFPPPSVAVAVTFWPARTPLIGTGKARPEFAVPDPTKVLPSPAPLGSGSAMKTSIVQPAQALPLAPVVVAPAMPGGAIESLAGASMRMPSPLFEEMEFCGSGLKWGLG